MRNRSVWTTSTSDEGLHGHMTLCRCVGPFNQKGLFKDIAKKEKKNNNKSIYNKVTQKDTRMEAFSPLLLMSQKENRSSITAGREDIFIFIIIIIILREYYYASYSWNTGKCSWFMLGWFMHEHHGWNSFPTIWFCIPLSDLLNLFMVFEFVFYSLTTNFKNKLSKNYFGSFSLSVYGGGKSSWVHSAATFP